MKIKHMIIVSLILAIITIGAVSATDSTDALAVENTDGDEISPVNDGALADINDPDGGNDDGDGQNDGENDPEEDTREDISEYAWCPGDLSVDNDYSYIGAKIPGEDYPDVTGNITITIDGDKKYEEPVSLWIEEWDDEEYDYVYSGGNYIFVNDFDLKNGEHDVVISYTGDDNYKPFTEQYTMYLTFMEVYWNSQLVEGVENEIEIFLASTATGNVEILIDNKSYMNLTATQLQNYRWVEIKDLEFTEHTYTINYRDDELYSLDEPFEGEFTYEYKFSVYMDEEFEYGVYCGDTPFYNAYVPSTGNGVIIVSLNGKTFNVTPNAKGRATITITDYELGENEINFTYVSDKYPKKTAERSFYVQPKVNIPYYVGYGSDDAISFTLPTDTIGNLEIYQGVYNETTEETDWILVANQTMKDGKASYPVSNLPLGEHTFKAVYEGNYSKYLDSPYIIEMNVVPNIIIDEYVYEGVNDNVKITLPEDYNKTLIVKIVTYKYDDDLEESVIDFEKVIYNATAKGTLTIPIPKLEYDGYYLLVDEISKEFYYGTWVYFPENITSDGEEIQVDLDGKEGYINLYIDGKLYQTEFLDADGMAQLIIKDLEIKTHTYELSYFNKNNEKIMTKTGSFNYDYGIYTNLDYEYYRLTNEFELIIDVPEDATSAITIDVNGKTYTANPINGTAEVIITNLVMGENNVTITYNGDKKYPAKTIKDLMNVAYYGITEKYDDETYEPISVSLLLPTDAKGNLTLYKATYDEEEYEWISTGEVVKTVKLVDGYATIEIPELPIGNYGFIALYECEEEQDYPVDEYVVEKTVKPDINVTTEVLVGQNVTISVYIPDAKGVIVVYEYDDYYEKHIFTTIESDNGTFKTSLQLGFGYYEISLDYVGDDYEDVLGGYEIRVTPIKAELKETSNDGTAVFSLELPEGISGNVTVYTYVYDDEYGYYEEIMTISNYTSQNKTFTVTGLKSGYHDLRIVYATEEYGEYKFDEEFSIDKPSADSNVTIPETITSDSFDVVLPEDATGGILVTIDGNTTYIPLENGKAKVNVGNLPEGKHDITITYPGDGNYSKFEKTASVTVPSPAVPVKIDAKDLSVQYLDGTKYTVTVYGTDGKVAAGAEVVFKINGKKVGSAKTDAKGVATLKITQVPKTYKITTEALGASVTKKLTVKQVLTLKKVKVKKSAKKLVLTATLKKVKGKYLKGKKITFKFNGKKFTAKTNKKGVAKVTIKKKVLKKLKVGKKVKYTATYSKTTVKKSVKVKK